MSGFQEPHKGPGWWTVKLGRETVEGWVFGLDSGRREATEDLW